MPNNARKVFTKEITNDTFTVSSNDGFQRFSVYNSSSVAGTIQGNLTSNGEPSGTISVAQYETVVVDVGNAYVIENLVVTAPASCTLKLMGS